MSKRKQNLFISITIFFLILFFYNYFTRSSYQFRCDLFHLSEDHLPYERLDIEIIEYDYLRKIIKKSFGKINIFSQSNLVFEIYDVYDLIRYQTLHLYDKEIGKGGVKIGSFYKVSKNLKLIIENEEYQAKCKSN